ncbi:MAG: OadG family protein [Paludibacter sp.]|nr:OadG family protein [Paludibacter sp.]MDD4197796.1 OadG family protein [Paludibacter sp.]MDD4428020.1 OadG family protein [Paludibacter sp.]
MQPLNEAILIMAVGMITVFFILFLIVLIGDLIIRLSNKYLPEEAVAVKAKKTGTSSDNTMKAIEAAIDVITNGRGKVTNIKKI